MSYWTLFTDPGLAPNSLQWYCVSTVFGTGEEDTVHNIVSARPYDIISTSPTTPIPGRTGAIIESAGLSATSVDPYSNSSQVTVGYNLIRRAEVWIKLLDERSRAVKAVPMGTQATGAQVYTWGGVIDYTDVVGNSILAPQGAYRLYVEAYDATDPNLSDSYGLDVSAD